MPSMSEVAGSEFESPADLVLLAMGFVHPVHTGMIEQFGVDLDPRGNVKVDKNHMTSKKGVFRGWFSITGCLAKDKDRRR